ncbi:MAG: UDP-N-acetylmuramate dehydrogenase [Synergistaceae bacterium]|jgi:UDP-N-acetylmuramate dehydrogenase|nr:UDP-N-acetylmuramate dehydrogenase [Synergistaceae bacterium]
MKRLSAPDIPGNFVRYNAPLAPYATWGVGGVAETLFTPRDESELVTAVKWARDNRTDFYILGGGSNVLISDDVISVPVVLMTGISGIGYREDKDDILLDCMAGTNMKDVLSLTVKNGWSGLEMAAGIPGSVGGAVAGNAGTSQGFIGSSVDRVVIVDADGTVSERMGHDMGWDYRKCGCFSDSRRVALSVTFRMRRSSPEDVADAMRTAMQGRSGQPVASRTAGCVFRNPIGDSAGRMLDVSGCKGMSVGGARVSDAHANFIENVGGCSACDIMSLAMSCRKKVMDSFGTLLTFEVKMLGLSD